LHDVVAHHVSVIVIQASAARRLSQGESDPRTDGLASIESAGRQALTELRTLLGALRGDEGDAALEPQPTLEHLEDLVQRTRASGLDVELIVDGERRALPSGVEVSAYRIVQEALTNALKHSGARSVTVRLSFAPHEVVVDIADDGVGGDRESDGRGHGLVGMRERVSLFGGSFHAGPLLGGGWRVRASLPLDREDA
ncbi:MAG TPA: ATP-binding protein, partial [Actinomycetota bacterium]|nr:ATP-binding protein [Actinomycetota bacterium]